MAVLPKVRSALCAASQLPGEGSNDVEDDPVSARVPTHQGKVREICFFFKVREKSGNSVKWSGKLENLQKSGKSQGILKSCLVNPSKIKQTNMR